MARFAEQLSGILAFAAEIQAVPTDDVDLPHGSLAVLPLREDIVAPSLPREEILHASHGADEAGGFFTVPRVLAE